ncbi:hypothetical protein PFTANZ_06617, partial [Plasmodium falciparum Tanzania (2000708)]
MQRRAREQLEAGAGEIKLKGDATKGTYGQGGHGDVFKDVCNITANHSNSTYQFSNEPCGGKGTGDGINTRFVLETQWQPDEQYMRDDHKDVLIPPRRRHICTSNLEYLQTKDKPLNGNDGADKVNHSFLGDVLLSAKSEAQNIIDTYKRHNGAEVVSDPKHQETMCRAIRYSFADLGDIIRGRDIWDREPGMNFLQGYLKDVFDNIRTSLTGKGIKTYDKDKDHIKIREDWWEANRHQVWRAMKCATQDIKNMKCNGIPIEDYIPQRLRWMTEFAEWYVKFKSKVNKECKSRVFMTLHHGKKSTEDTSKCKEYKDKIEEWKGQWKKLGTKYSLLYGTAKVNAFKEGRDGNKIEVKEKDKSVYDFLFNLHVHNGGNVDPSSSTKSTRSTRPKRTITDTKTPYDNAGAYVNDTVDLSDSKYEREFCDRGKTFKPSDQPSPTSTDDDTATPEEDEGKTEEDEEEEEEEEEEDEERPPQPEAPQEPVPKEKVKVCDIVDGILNENNGTTKVGECNPKDQGARYPGWNCTNPILVTKNGECMPPRRQKLCLFYLADINEQNKIHNQDDLRKAFIKTAAAETFLSWHYYKSKNSMDIKKLESGTIPEEFLRFMFYTYGDYRDICLDTDISAKTENGDITKAKDKIGKVFSNSDAKSPGNLSRQEWWDEHGKEIWKGMLCALSYDKTNKNMIENVRPQLTSTYNYDTIKNNLEDFAKTPQFLRWFTEWSDEFCREHKTQLESLKKKCPEDTCTNEGKKKECSDACKKYQEFINKWKPQYENQREKFKKDKKNNQYSNYPSTERAVQKAVHAHEYLNQQLQNICKNGDCSCMKNPSTHSQSQTQPQKKKQEQPDSFEGNDMPASLDKVPEGYENKCNCKPPENKENDSSVNCIDTSAFELKKEAQKSIKDVKKTLSGKTPQTIYEKMNNDSNRNDGTICKIKENGSTQNNECNDIGNPFDDIDKWECTNPRNKVTNEDICLPPRRKHMCTKPLKELEIDKDKNIEELFKKVLLTAAYEGKHIKESWDKVNEPKKKTQICDAMKYSFADLADIVRGTDKYKNTNGNSSGSNSSKIEERLKNVFQNIQKTEGDLKNKYPDDTSDFYKLRSAWWDINRKEVWKAMTCSAPEEANIFKDKKNKITNEQERITLYHCGHDSDPPVDDYIPQPFRWMKEWSENYCNAQNNKLSLFKDCEYCKKNKEKCKQTTHGSCKKCKEKCEEYNEFVKKWEKQYEILEKTYKHLYEESQKNVKKKSAQINTNDDQTKKFIDYVEKNCSKDKTKTDNTVNSIDKYLDKGNYCKTVRFQKDVSNNKTYAFDNPPKRYKESCRCATNFEEVDQCPVDEKECNKYGNHHCIEKYFNKRLYDRTNDFVKKDVSNNESVMIPPRRRQLCLSSMSIDYGSINTEQTLKEYIFHSASNEAKHLWEIHKEDSKKSLMAMKYSFADYGDIVKGTDMLNELEFIQQNLDILFKKKPTGTGNGNVSENRKKWWENNKEKIWNVMMCNYHGSDKTSTTCPSHGDIDEQDQFLRWFQEWGENFCTGRNELYENLVSECKSVTCNKEDGSLSKSGCTEACEKYKNYILSKEKEYEIQKKKYDNRSRNSYDNKKAHNFLIYNCNENKCHCIYNLIDDKNRTWKDAYDTFDDDKFKDKCDCPKPVPIPPPLPPPPADESFNRDILEKTIPFGVALALGSIAFFFMK